MSNASTNAMAPTDPTLSPLAGIGPGEEGKPEGGPAGEVSPALEGLVLGDGKPRMKISGAWLIILGAVMVSAGVLWGMRYVGMKGGVSSKDVSFDESLVEAVNRPKRDHSAVLDDLKSSRVSGQVPSESVKKNPFRMADSMVTGMPQVDQNAEGDKAARAMAAQLEAQKRKEADRVHAIQTQLSGLRLQAVLGGSPPLARISGKTVRVGDKVAEFFTIKTIHGRTVDLECEGALYELAMSAGDLGGE